MYNLKYSNHNNLALIGKIVCQNLGLDTKNIFLCSLVQKLCGHLGFWPFLNIQNINILFSVDSRHLDIMKDSIKSMFDEVWIKKYDKVYTYIQFL